MTPTEPNDLLLPGPWTHRDITANGVRLHVAEAGRGPLVVLLHGFPQFWWAWRHQIPALADAGFRVVAPDLRGLGASDKPPRPYDPVTTAGDIAGLVRALGRSDAYIVGSDLGGMIGWTMAALHPGMVRGLAVLGTAHPRRWRREMVFADAQRRASSYIFAAQPPRLPEARLVHDHGAKIADLMTSWAGPWRVTSDFADAVALYRAAICVPQAAYGAAEYFRWMVRSLMRPDGLAFVQSLRRRADAPVLQLHGADDPCVLPRTADGAQAYTSADYRWRLLADCGHFPAEEQPATVTDELVGWLRAYG
ncbi:alpha/beta fold hydrolase [Cumulibacter manganitolerans]|uniref:alpha/beta fold hydrolase n=1 Tax=Cumulibacter manganitolerans TaxID=1884992 RepID=UPI001297EC69|nr:alpha/beta hydrolase [Cumulibacter manganitolerans]